MKSAAVGSGAAAAAFADLEARLLLDNDRVRVERYAIEPGQSTGAAMRTADHLLVHIKGGLLTLQPSGRVTRWRDGQVTWRSRGAAAGESGINSGDTTIEIVCVTLKAPAAGTSSPAAGARQVRPVHYPHIPGEDLLENESVIVQRFIVPPGQWEGVHAHHSEMLYIHVSGGQWAERTHTMAARAYPEASPDGEVGWMPAIPLSVGHESGNVGASTIDLIWVTPKR